MPEQQTNHQHQGLYSVYALFMALLFVLLNGYQFNSGDQAEHLPQVYRMFDPDLYPNDFFLNLYDQTFTVRTYWVRLVYAVSLLTGVTAACFILHLSCLYLSTLAWMKTTRLITDNLFAPFISPLLIFFLFNSYTVGGNTLSGIAFVGSIPAEAFASWGILLWLRNKQPAAALVLGIACIFQLLVGLQLFLLFSVVFALNGISLERIKNYGLQLLLFLVGSAPILYPVFARQLFVPSPPGDLSVFYQTLYYQRAPWHYIPSLFPIKDYIFTGLLLIVAVLFFKRQTNVFNRTIGLFLFAILAGCIVYIIFVEGLQVMSIAKLQWFKTTVWLNAFCCVMIAGYLGKLIPANISVGSKLKYMKWGLWIAGLCMLFVITHSKYIQLSEQTDKYKIGRYQMTSLELMHEWIRNNTPKEALFLIPPNNESFSCEAQRSTPVNYKALVHEPFYFVAWRKSMQEYYGVDFKVLGNNPVLPLAQKNYYVNFTDTISTVDYQLFDITLCNPDPSQVVHRDGNWVLLKTKP